ncbi:MAG: hypothetical protein KJ727_10570 [Acidobacteria bacterium]|nr:hypothetical protein [Acidobacteriota bacterium]MCG2814899.1 hypothetical protein [Candidatus Aminicenantes bacterium]
MKKRFCVAGILMIVLSGVGEARTSSRSLSLRFFGAWGPQGIGDFNAFQMDTQAYYDSLLLPVGFVREASLPGIRSNAEYRIEFMANLSERFSLGLGLGILQGKTDASAAWDHPDYGGLSVDSRIGLDAFPILAVGAYVFPLSDGLNLYARIGAGAFLYSGRMDYSEISRVEGSYWTFSSNLDVRAGGFGLTAGLGLERELGSGIRIFVEGGGRLARSGGLKGRYYYSGSRTAGFEGDGVIWYYEYYDRNADSFLSGITCGERPDGENLRNIHPMRIDFSGLCVRIGVRLSLFDWER